MWPGRVQCICPIVTGFAISVPMDRGIVVMCCMFVFRNGNTQWFVQEKKARKKLQGSEVCFLVLFFVQIICPLI